MTPRITFISASAGSGKTHRVVDTIEERLVSGACRPGGLIATTFTVKAAHELRERVRGRLHHRGHTALAERLDEGLIGTVHGVCRQLLERFTFEAGISPRIEILAEEQASELLAQAVESVADFPTLQRLQQIAVRLGQQDRQTHEFNWKSQVREIVNAVQANDLDEADFPAMADRSVAELLAFLPPPTTGDLDRELLAAISTAIGRISGNGDETVTTRKYLDFLRDCRRDLENASLSWSAWVKIAKDPPAKASQAEATPVMGTAARFETHPRLREDIREYTTMLFTLAQRCITGYRRLKEERGFMDFSDLEQRTLRLLRDVPFAKEVLREELDLLVVDEFQDTSPIQLGLFMELAACGRETVWVGDVKQAIYGFRHSDPTLVNVVVAAVQGTGGLAQPLGNSYRAAPDLVRLSNALFAPAFADSLGVPEAQVRLAAVRKSIEPAQNAVEIVELCNDKVAQKASKPKRLNNEDFAAAVAERVSQWLAAPEPLWVEDRETKSARRLQPRDIAILCRTNPAAAELAERLSARGLPVSLVQNGLFATPEGRLGLACLRRLADPADTLATAEIIALQATLTPEQWLERRFDYLDQLQQRREATGTTIADRWGVEGPGANPAIEELEKARSRLTAASPSEALDLALEAGDVFATITAWGPSSARAAQRRANLESLRALVRQYEQGCETNSVPATVAGLLFWCEDLATAKVDAKGFDEQVNAVHISTYHKAKGLEWPLVVCTDLDEKPKPRLWGLTVAAQDPGKPFDLNQPLANRRLRFWPWPFGGHTTGIPLSARVDASPAGQEAAGVATQEELRLLYVGFTRARDVLVIARDIARPTPWLDLLGTAWLKPTGTKLRLPDGETIQVSRVTVAPPEEVSPPAPDPTYAWFPASSSPTRRVPARLTPSGQPPIAGARAGRIIDLGSRLPFAGAPDEADLGDALHAILAAELINPGHPGRLGMVRRILDGYGLSNCLRGEDVLAMADRFRLCLEREFQPARMLVEVPFETTNEQGQRVEGFIDLLLETAGGWVLIDHKSFPGARSEWQNKATSYSGQLALYHQALLRLGKPVASLWIHFTVGGGLIEMLTEAAEQSTSSPRTQGSGSC